VGFLDELNDLTGVVDRVEAPLKVVAGTINGAQDATHLIGNVADGNFGAAMTDGRKLFGDAMDLAEGIGALGGATGTVPTGLSGLKNTVAAESQIIWAAQRAIDGMKLTTGSGTPYAGDDFLESSQHLTDVVNTLIDAAPHTDRWDGTASQVYNATNASHRRLASDVQVADSAIAGILSTEAGQVQRTRDTLEEASNDLGNYDLATQWMNASGPGRVAKFALDCATAGAALQAASITLGILVKNSVENGSRIREHISTLKKVGDDTSGGGACDVFEVPSDPDIALPRSSKQTPLPDPDDEFSPPSRSDPNVPYTVPAPETPIPNGPPARPN
jgi:hypothetical protein